jgi:excisionase family DNA binding protein
MDPTATPTLIPVTEAAKIAGVSKFHIYRLINAGTVDAVRVGDGGGPIRVDRERFLAWLFSEPEED